VSLLPASKYEQEQRKEFARAYEQEQQAQYGETQSLRHQILPLPPLAWEFGQEQQGSAQEQQVQSEARQCYHLDSTQSLGRVCEQE